jgi:Right handed beta helix region
LSGFDFNSIGHNPPAMIVALPIQFRKRATLRLSLVRSPERTVVPTFTGQWRWLLPASLLCQLATLTVIFLPSCVDCKAADYYVATDGNDLNPGSLEKPFLTLDKARNTLREIAPSMDADAVVHVRGGTYRLSAPAVFGSEDSGRNGHRIIYQAQENEIPIITGLQVINKWVLQDARKNICRAPIGSLDFRQVYFDGKPGMRARFPRMESSTDLGPYFRMHGADVKGRRYVIAKADWDKVAGAANKAGLELVAHEHWIHHNARIESALPHGNEVLLTPRAPERNACFNKPSQFFRGASCYFENAYEFIAGEGDWCVDGANLYFKPPPPVSGTVVCEVPTLDTLIEIKGTATDPVHDLEFRGLTIEGSNWASPNHHGIVATQFVQPYNATRTYENPDYPPGMIRLAHTLRVAFRHNVIRKAGANGIQIWADADDTDIEGNQFYDIAANAIEIDAHARKNPPPELQSTNIAIWNNDFHRAGCVYSNGGAILAHFVSGLIVEHNEISDMPYSGLQVGDQPGGYLPMGCTGNKIRFNLVHHTNQQHDDGGGIYTLGGQQTGSEIVQNYIHHVVRSRWAQNFAVLGIYLDNKTQFIKVAVNVIEACSGGAGQLNGSRDNLLQENSPKNPAVRESVIRNAGIKPDYSPRK